MSFEFGDNKTITIRIMLSPGTKNNITISIILSSGQEIRYNLCRAAKLTLKKALSVQIRGCIWNTSKFTAHLRLHSASPQQLLRKRRMQPESGSSCKTVKLSFSSRPCNTSAILSDLMLDIRTTPVLLSNSMLELSSCCLFVCLFVCLLS